MPTTFRAKLFSGLTGTKRRRRQTRQTPLPASAPPQGSASQPLHDSHPTGWTLSATTATFFVLALGLPAGAQAAPSGIGSAQDTVNELEHNGFKVVLNKMGAAPLDHCTVDSVRPGETVSRLVQNGNQLVNQTVYQPYI